MTPQQEFEALKRLPDEELKMRLRSLPPKRLLELAIEGARGLQELFDRIPELIYDEMESKLPADEKSASEANLLLLRLQRK